MKIVNVECWVENLVCRMSRNESMQVNITQCVIVLHCRNCLNTFTPPNFNVKWLFWAPNHISTCCRFRNKSYYWKAQERQNAALCREIFVVWFASWASLWCWERYPHGSLQILRKYPYNISSGKYPTQHFRDASMLLFWGIHCNYSISQFSMHIADRG